MIPFAVDKNFNIGYPLPTGATLLTGNFKVSAAPHSVGDNAPAGVALSTASAATNSISLRFLAALNADSASDAGHYSVTVNGQAVSVESAGYNGTTHSVTLSLPEGSLKAGDAVVVTYSGLSDSTGQDVAGQTATLTAR